MDLCYEITSTSYWPNWRSIGSIPNSMVCVLFRVRAYQKLRSLVGLFEYEEYISLKSINDPNEG